MRYTGACKQDAMILPVHLTGYRPKKDRSVTISFTTAQEIYDVNDIHRMSTVDAFGILYFREGEDAIDPSLKEELDAVDLDLEDPKKSPSQRLRNTLYVYWTQNFQDHTDWKDFYKTEMEKIINSYKNKLDAND